MGSFSHGSAQCRLTDKSRVAELPLICWAVTSPHFLLEEKHHGSPWLSSDISILLGHSFRTSGSSASLFKVTHNHSICVTFEQSHCHDLPKEWWRTGWITWVYSNSHCLSVITMEDRMDNLSLQWCGTRTILVFFVLRPAVLGAWKCSVVSCEWYAGVKCWFYLYFNRCLFENMISMLGVLRVEKNKIWMFYRLLFVINKEQMALLRSLFASYFITILPDNFFPSNCN